MISYNFSPLADAEAASPTASCNGTSGKSFENNAALTISHLDICVEYPYNNLCLECNMHQLLYSFVIYDFLRFLIQHPK